jgi:hypothetical protein
MKQAWRTLIQISVRQVLGASLLAMLIWGLVDLQHGLAVLSGALILLSGTLVAARWGLRRSNSPEASVAWVLAAIAWKWMWVVAGLALAIIKLQLPGIGLVAGIVGAQLFGIIAGMQRTLKS